MKRLTPPSASRTGADPLPCIAEPASSGYTLLEALIVILLLAAAAGWAASSIGSWSDETRLLLAGRRLVAELRSTRQMAIAHAVPYGLAPAAEQTAYAVYRGTDRDPSPRRVPLGNGLGVAGRAVWFHPRGNAAPAGSLNITGSGRKVRVTISVSGRIRWEVRP